MIVVAVVVWAMVVMRMIKVKVSAKQSLTAGVKVVLLTSFFVFTTQAQVCFAFCVSPSVNRVFVIQACDKVEITADRPLFGDPSVGGEKTMWD